MIRDSITNIKLILQLKKRKFNVLSLGLKHVFVSCDSLQPSLMRNHAYTCDVYMN